MDRKQKIIAITAAVILGVILVAATVYALAPRSTVAAHDIEVQVIDTEAGEYMVMNVPTDHQFHIELTAEQDASDGSFDVFEITGEKVETNEELSETSLTIQAPDDGYEEGTLYSLDLEGKGKFTDEEYEEAQKILFCTERNRNNYIDYTDNVISTNGSDVNIDNDRITVEGTYSDGNIILTDSNDDGIDELYKLENAVTEDNITAADIVEPAAEEVYQEIDVFHYDVIDPENIEIDEEKIIGNLEKTGILDAFIGSAYAFGVPNVEVVKELGGKDGYTLSVVIKDPTDERRQLQISFGIKDTVTVIVNDDIAMFDNTLTVTDSLEFSVKGQDKVQTEEKIRDAIEKYMADEDIAGETESKLPLVPIDIPIYGVIVVHAELGLTAETEYSAEFRAGIEAEAILKQGIIYDFDEKEINKLYGDVSGDINGYLMAQGTLNAFAGAYVEAGLKVPCLLEIGLQATGGPYLEAEGSFIIDGIPRDISAEGYYRAEIGVLLKAGVNVDIIFFGEHDYELANKKHPLWQVEKEPEMNLLAHLKSKARYIGMTNKEITEEMGELRYYLHDDISWSDLYEIPGENIYAAFDMGNNHYMADNIVCELVMGKLVDIFPYDEEITVKDIENNLRINFAVEDVGMGLDDGVMYTAEIELDKNTEYTLAIIGEKSESEIPGDSIVYIAPRGYEFNKLAYQYETHIPFHTDLIGMTIDEVIATNADAVNHGAANGRNWVELKNEGIYTGHIYQGSSAQGYGMERGSCVAITGDFSSLFGNTSTSIDSMRNGGIVFETYDDISMRPEGQYFYDIFPQLYYEDSPHYGQTGQIYSAELMGSDGRMYEVYVVSEQYDGVINADSMCTICYLPQ